MHASQTITLVTMPPPTPNGDLHVGHLSGPYLGADVFSRYCRLKGAPTVSAFSSDTNQSYVVTTAERLGTDPHVLAHDSHECFRHTLEAGRLEFDVLGKPDRAYSTYIAEHFERLHRHGVFTLRMQDVLFHPPTGRHLFESYAQGRCNICLARTKGNICENCGHPNDPLTLLDVQASGQTGNENAFELRKLPTLVLELERYRPRLVAHFKQHMAPLRPELQRLCDELLSSPLPEFPITYPSDWGIPADFSGIPGSVINVWAEMQPGHLFWLSEAWQNSLHYDGRDLAEHTTRYVQFLGFDNSFFYVFAHIALAFAARDSGLFSPLPGVIVTNEFYQLENAKFSTSQGHLIWARDLLVDESADEVRFYLCWSNPEYQKANFTRAEMGQVVKRYFRQPLAEILGLLEQRKSALAQTTKAPQDSVRNAALAAQQRIAASFEADSMSLRRAAQTIVDGLEWCVDLGRAASPGDCEKSADFRCALEVLAIGLAPIAPGIAGRLWHDIGHSEPMAWPGVETELEHHSSFAVAG